MPNKRYNRGSSFERQIQDKLKDFGFYSMRSAGSHTVVDVIAISINKIYLIQCKTSITETIPDTKQLFKSFESDGTKTNIKKLEELDTPELYGGYPVDKFVIWKGKGRNNMITFIWTGIKWKIHHDFEI